MDTDMNMDMDMYVWTDIIRKTRSAERVKIQKFKKCICPFNWLRFLSADAKFNLVE